MEVIIVSCSKNLMKGWLGSRAISNLIATLILIAIAVVGGAFAYTTFRNQAETITTAADVQVQSLKAVDVGGATYVSAALKNVGTQRLTNVRVTVNPGGDGTSGNGVITLGDKNPPSDDFGSINPGASKPSSQTGCDDTGTLDGGSSYPVLVEARTPDGGSIAKTMTVRVER